MYSRVHSGFSGSARLVLKALTTSNRGALVIYLNPCSKLNGENILAGIIVKIFHQRVTVGKVIGIGYAGFAGQTAKLAIHIQGANTWVGAIFTGFPDISFVGTDQDFYCIVSPTEGSG